MSNSPFILAQNVRKSFQHMGHPLDVLRGIDMTISEGELIGIVGPSGAGKSTFLHCMGTLDVPTEGKICLQGQDLSTLSNAQLASLRNRMIGFVFQFHHLLPEFTALENVIMPGLIQGRERAGMQTRGLALLEEVGLRDRASHRPGELSGGEQQRVAVARALVLEPKLILADEPTGNLDSAVGESIMELLTQLHKDGRTILIVTHDEATAAYAGRELIIADGTIASDKPQRPRESTQGAA